MVSKKVQEEEKKGVEGIRLSKAGGRRRERGCRSKLSRRLLESGFWGLFRRRL